jgi:autotransporter-associated beta strand protein
VGGANYSQHFWNSPTINMTGGLLYLGNTLNEFYNPAFNVLNTNVTAQILGVTTSAQLRLRDGTSGVFSVDDGAQDVDLLVNVPITYNSATSGITKNGAGRMVLAKDNSYNGTTVINGGVLVVDNPTSSASGTGSGAVQVNNGGTLCGTGRVANVVTVATNGTISAGDPAVVGGVGVLQAASNVTFQAGGVLGVRMKDDQCNKLVVGGTAVIANATLSVTTLNDVLSSSKVYTALVANAVSGQFAGIPEGGQIKTESVRVEVSYTSQAVLLRRMSSGLLLIVE